jgi:hypothetical protein
VLLPFPNRIPGKMERKGWFIYDWEIARKTMAIKIPAYPGFQNHLI